ncbi:MAG: bifunctional DNA primase/polymerase [Mycobacteriales bacterium]
MWSLRHSAATYAAHGWPVVPGAYAVEGSRSPRLCGARTSLAPLSESWQEAATTDVMQVARWWARHAWVILLPTGRGVDVVEMPAAIGQATVDLLDEHIGPVAVEAGQRWLVFCSARPGAATTTGDESRAGVLLHTLGSWVPVPPIGRARDRLTWLRSPWACGWRLPDAGSVLAAARG